MVRGRGLSFDYGVWINLFMPQTLFKGSIIEHCEIVCIEGLNAQFINKIAHNEVYD